MRVWVEAYPEELLRSCTRVTYRLHDSFGEPVIATEARDKEFELWLSVYGEFTVIACVEREGQGPVWTSR